MDSLVTKDKGIVQNIAPSCIKKGDHSLREGVTLKLSEWSALQMALQNKWGGLDSYEIYQQLISDVVSWFSQPRGDLESSLHVEDLENLLHETMLLSFNTEIEDGSIEEVAEQLMIMHEESLQGSIDQNHHPNCGTYTCKHSTAWSR